MNFQDKNNPNEFYGFTLNTTNEKIHFIKDVIKDGVAERHGIEDGDCVLVINKIFVHKKMNNKVIDFFYS